MVLNKEIWTESDRAEFVAYMKSLERPEKVKWSAGILQTGYPVLALTTDAAVKVAKEIMKGDYRSFLRLGITDYYETVAIYGMILSRMKSTEEFIEYLEKYLDYMDCWAHVDLLVFPNLSESKDTYIALSEKYRSDPRTMVRRLSLNILFRYVKEKGLLGLILDSLKAFQDETEYYVIMMAGWLLSEAIILHEEETLEFITNNDLNKKIVNKAIQKCRESNRLIKEEKDFLLKYKVK